MIAADRKTRDARLMAYHRAGYPPLRLSPMFRLTVNGVRAIIARRTKQASGPTSTPDRMP